MPAASLDNKMLFILNDIKDELQTIDNKLDRHTIESARNGQRISTIELEVNKLTKVVQTGNGQPSLIVRVSELSNKIDMVKDNQTQFSEHLRAVSDSLTDLNKVVENMRQAVGAKTPEELKLEKWKTVGKLAGLLALVLPGFLALFGS